MNAEKTPTSGKFHWVEGRYRRDDASVFTKRFYLPVDCVCPAATEDDSGRSGSLIEGSCIVVNKDCFIATAAFGSELDSRVSLLRRFRDDFLLQTDLREPFSRVLAFYYRFSPPIASVMRRHKIAKLLLKWILAYPAVLFAWVFVYILRTTHRDFGHHRNMGG